MFLLIHPRLLAFSLQPSASCLPTPSGPKNFDAQRKRQQIIHHFAFRLRSVSFAKILGLSWCRGLPRSFLARRCHLGFQPLKRQRRKYYLEWFIINFMCEFCSFFFSFVLPPPVLLDTPPPHCLSRFCCRSCREMSPRTGGSV